MREDEVAPDRPFELRLVGDLGSGGEPEPVFTFVADDEEYYGFLNPMNFLPVAEMSLDDLRVQGAGSAWIGARDPVDLATSRIRDERVAPGLERKERLEELVSQVAPGARLREGLFLADEGFYLALAETDERVALVISDSLEHTERVAFPRASPWRRLSYGVGRLLADGRL